MAKPSKIKEVHIMLFVLKEVIEMFIESWRSLRLLLSNGEGKIEEVGQFFGVEGNRKLRRPQALIFSFNFIISSENHSLRI